MPQIIGHEISGVVCETGANISKFKVGDRVAVGADIPCGECAACEAGHGNNCQTNLAMGYQFAGGFAEYVLLNRTVLSYGPVHKIPDHVSFEKAALAEPLGCVLNGLELSNVQLGDTVAIIGCGPIGCMLLTVAKKMGAIRTIVVEKNRMRLEQAKQFGADIAICIDDEDPVERVLAETGGLGADVVITANAVPSTQVQALQMANFRARVNFFGGLPAGKSMVTLDTNIIHYRELFVHGTHGSLPRHHQKAIDLISTGAIDIEKFISHRFDLDQIKEAFAAAENCAGLRVIVKP
jgi:L-iditol 2-dehydrogenase